MKKILIGFIAGAAFMMSAQAFGSGVSFLGKKVDGQAAVTIDGEKIGDAIIINGKSFAPVREITNGFGGKVNSANGGVIALGTNGSGSSIANDTTSQVVDIQSRIASKQSDVEKITKQVDELQQKVDGLVSSGMNAIPQTIELNAMKDELNKQKTELESLKTQLAELQK